MINVSSPFLPPLEEYQAYLADIWKRNWLTNNGPLVNELELKLKEYLDLSHFLYLGNGTIALQIAIKALELKGEIITTPFSYVATTSSIVWEGCTPIYVDIDPETLNIDARKIEAAITEKTSAILATHVYGNPCDIKTIEEIAQKHRLKVIFDAAHCFGTKYKGKSVFGFGDISTASFHATKLFHTVEGGGVFTRNPRLLEKMSFLKNFGHNGPTEFAEVGINGKNSELHAAMGLVNLKYINGILAKRKELSDHYNKRLEGMKISRQTIIQDASFNYAYYPVVFQDEHSLLKAMNLLNSHEIFPRRYFYPSLHTISYTSGKFSLPVSEAISSRVLCLPLYYELSKEEVDFICRLLLRSQKY
jgi:dTDP-4-amino-4,6-dideoxygalactose transaminase